VTTHDVELTVLLSLDYGGTARSATCSWLVCGVEGWIGGPGEQRRDRRRPPKNTV
jgi:hypothetical protein